MDDILDFAGKLGKRIAADSRAQAILAAQKRLENSEEDRTLLVDYQAQQRRLAELEASQKPIEPDAKRKLNELHDRVISSSVLKDLLKSQVDYVDLMQQVYSRIERESLGSTPE